MDIDFETVISNENGFQLDLGESGAAVTGNRALVNRFEITFLTNSTSFVYGGQVEVDWFGGNSRAYIAQPTVLTDKQAIAAGVQAAIDSTVESIKAYQDGAPDTEKIDSAVITSLDTTNGVVAVGVRIIPVETEPWVDLRLNLPITRIGA